MKSTIIMIILFIGQKAFGQDHISKIDSLLTTMYKNENLNGNILIAEKGKVIYKKSFGFTNDSTKENSIFELASLSKQFTAMAIVILKEKKKLNYDDKMSKYIPELSHYDNITIRHLLNHTSGLPDYMEIMDTVFDKSKIAINDDIFNLFVKLKPSTLFESNTQ